MKISDEIIDAMIRAGLIEAFGGTGEEVTKVVATVGQCDEAHVILRSAGKNVGVLVVADDSQVNADEVRTRGQELLSTLQ